MKMESFVVPAWMAGIQVCRTRPETSMSAWIPALHAGMTESRSRIKTDRDPPPFLFSKEGPEGHEDRMIERASNLKKINLFFLRALRVLRGDIHFTFG
jgi:hypothetical protein